MRGTLLALMCSLTSGCYLVHERPEASVDAGIDSPRAIDAGHAAFVPDAFVVIEDVSNPDAGSCASSMPTTCAFDEEVDLTEAACGMTVDLDTDPRCVEIEVIGHDDLVGDPVPGCAAGTLPPGHRVLVRRCAPGARLTDYSVYVDDHEELIGTAVGRFDASSCGCSSLMGLGSAGTPETETMLVFYGEGRRYRVRLCATDCS